MSCCFDFSFPRLRGKVSEGRMGVRRKAFGSLCVIPPRLRCDPLPSEGGDFAIDSFVGWAGCSEAQHGLASMLGFSRTAFGISPTYAVTVRNRTFVGWAERSEAQRVRATTLGFSRTASGISPTYVTSPGISPACAPGAAQ